MISMAEILLSQVVGFISRLTTTEEIRSWKIGQNKILKLNQGAPKGQRIQRGTNECLEYSTNILTNM